MERQYYVCICLSFTLIPLLYRLPVVFSFPFISYLCKFLFMNLIYAFLIVFSIIFCTSHTLTSNHDKLSSYSSRFHQFLPFSFISCFSLFFTSPFLPHSRYPFFFYSYTIKLLLYNVLFFPSTFQSFSVLFFFFYFQSPRFTSFVLSPLINSLISALHVYLFFRTFLILSFHNYILTSFIS